MAKAVCIDGDGYTRLQMDTVSQERGHGPSPHNPDAFRVKTPSTPPLTPTQSRALGPLPGEWIEVLDEGGAPGTRNRIFRTWRPLTQNPPPADCARWRACLGCRLMPLSPQQQLDTKTQRLTAALAEHGIPANPIKVHPAIKRLGYRRRIRLKLDQGIPKFFNAQNPKPARSSTQSS